MMWFALIISISLETQNVFFGWAPAPFTTRAECADYADAHRDAIPPAAVQIGAYCLSDREVVTVPKGSPA